MAENTIGSYPLSVEFTDAGVQGTFPISTWSWSFGNDSISEVQNTNFTYLYPGEYDITLRVEDEFGLADTVFYPSLVQVDLVFGDVSWNGSVQAFDASKILKHLVGLETFTTLQEEIVM